MSDTETETPDTPDEETTETEPPETTPDEEEEEEEQTTAKAAKKEGSANLAYKINEANNQYIGKIQRLAGKDAQIDGCVYCQGLGFTMQGLETGPQPTHPQNLVMCESCNGYGEVLTGSRNPNHITALCVKCAGNGFVTLPELAQNVTPIQPYQPPPEQQLNGVYIPGRGFIPYGETEPLPGTAHLTG